MVNGHRLIFLVLALPVVIAVVAVVFIYMSGGAGSVNVLSSLPACGNETQFFTTLPTNFSNLANITPLGNLNPPQHTFPANHLYFGIGVSQNGVPLNTSLFAPGNTTIVSIGSNNANPQHTEYTVYFSSCGQFLAYYDHVTSLSPTLRALFTPPFSECSTDPFTGRAQCVKNLDVKVSAGQYIGTAGGFLGAPPSFDFAAVDYRLSPLAFTVQSHYDNMNLHYVCAINYFTPSLASRLDSILGLGSEKRITPPICGSINQDVPGTAQGNWFPLGMNFASGNLSGTIALVHNNINTTIGVFSIGNSMTSLGFQSGLYSFDPKNSGLVNLDFEHVRPGQVYCYETAFGFGSLQSQTMPSTVILVQLLDNSTLRIGLLPGSSGSCGTGPWNFTNGQWADFQR